MILSSRKKIHPKALKHISKMSLLFVVGKTQRIRLDEKQNDQSGESWDSEQSAQVTGQFMKEMSFKGRW